MTSTTSVRTRVSMWVAGAGSEFSTNSKSLDHAFRRIAAKFGVHAKKNIWFQSGNIVGSNSNSLIREGIIVHRAQVVCKVLYMNT